MKPLDERGKQFSSLGGLRICFIARHFTHEAAVATPVVDHTCASQLTEFLMAKVESRALRRRPAFHRDACGEGEPYLLCGTLASAAPRRATVCFVHR
ncbi:hypothetical protein B1806_04280 [Metallibacterium scheffleri]|uniref:Uncharacterized protein n=1 Tax=Metallibacterium scheffleri TaxID=993689 RepID=A0A4S3KQL9_9GAMM|nr:hypothetical protein B1806_04280 [Metallibacterium scheffleri]